MSVFALSMSLSFLKGLDLTETETKIYEFLVKEGESIVQTISKETKLKRPTVYKALYALENKRLIKKREILKKIHFQASPPSLLLNMVREKEEQIKEVKSSLDSILPSLSSSYILSTEKPIVRMYEGISGIKQIYLDILKDGRGGVVVMQIEDQDQELGIWLNSYFNPRRTRKKMPLKTICSDGKYGRRFKEKDKENYRFTKLVPAGFFKFQHEVTVYGDKMAFIHYKNNNPLIGVVINHPFFAETMRAWFNLAWEGAEKYSTK